MASKFQALGAEVEICCNFKVVNTVSKLLEHFLDVDICVGIHGAGLANCAFGRSGMVVTELMQEHGFGTELYMKIAHMNRGNYIFHDFRGAKKLMGKNGGAILNEESANDLALLSFALLPKNKEISIIQESSVNLVNKRSKISSSVLENVLAPEIGKYIYGIQNGNASKI